MQVDVGEQRRDDAALRRARHRTRPLPVFHHACREPLPQQLQHPPVRDTLADQHQQLGVVDAAEVVADVGVEHVVPAARATHAQGFQCLRRAPLRPEPIRRGPEIRLENGLQHERRSHLRHSVSNRRNAERPLSAIGLRDVSPQDRLRTIRAGAQRGAEFVQQTLDAILLDDGQGHRIDPRRAAVPLHPPPCLLEDVTPPDPVHQGMEAALRGSLGRDPQPALQLAHFVEDGRLGGSWNRTCRSCPRACLLAQRDHRRDPSLPSRCSSRGSSLLRSPRTPAAPRSISPSAYTSRVAPTRAAQTGLSCSALLRARVLRPLPRRDLRHVTSGLRHRRRGLRRDMSGSALGLYICRGCRLHFMLRPACWLPP